MLRVDDGEFEKYKTLDVYGENILSTTYGQWKKHRAAAKNAFNEVRPNNYSSLVIVLTFFSGQQCLCMVRNVPNYEPMVIHI